MNDDLTTLASSYLDGELTDDERARVDGDPGLLAAVERLRAVRAVLGHVEPAPISVRERHLAAALDTWDRIPAAERSGELRDATPPGADAAALAGAASVTAPVPLAGRRRRRGNRVMLAAAAALVLVLAGGLVARNALRGTTDDDVASSADAAPATTVPTGRDALEVQAADETFGTDSAGELVVAAPNELPAAADTFIGSDEAPPDEDLELLASDEDLAIFADDLLRLAPGPDEVTAADQPAADAEAGAGADDGAAFEQPFPTCDLVDRIVAPARWDVDGLFDELVVVGIDDAAGEAVAYSPETCNVVARTPLLDR